MSMHKTKEKKIPQSSILNTMLQDCLKNTFRESLNEWDQSAALDIHSIDSMSQATFDSTGLITLSSYDFKMIMVLYFNMTKSLREFTINVKNDKADNIFNDTVVNDYVMEMCNGLGGRLKRCLQATSFALGMSTPNLVARKQYIISDIADFDFASHIKCDVNTAHTSESVHFGLSLFSRIENIDVFESRCREVSLGRVQEDNSVGELEMF